MVCGAEGGGGLRAGGGRGQELSFARTSDAAELHKLSPSFILLLYFSLVDVRIMMIIINAYISRFLNDNGSVFQYLMNVCKVHLHFSLKFDIEEHKTIQ